MRIMWKKCAASVGAANSSPRCSFYMEEIERDGSEEWDQVHKKQKRPGIRAVYRGEKRELRAVSEQRLHRISHDRQRCAGYYREFPGKGCQTESGHYLRTVTQLQVHG